MVFTTLVSRKWGLGGMLKGNNLVEEIKKIEEQLPLLF